MELLQFCKDNVFDCLYLDSVDVDLFITGVTESSNPRWSDIVSKSIIRAVEWACIAARYSEVSNVALVGL